jgi:hypothetical protein
MTTTHLPRVQKIQRIHRLFDDSHQFNCPFPKLINQILLLPDTYSVLSSAYKFS